MIPYSLICSKWKGEVEKASRHGCSEFPALNWNVEYYISIPIFAFAGNSTVDELHRSMNILYEGKNNIKDYYLDWIKFCLEFINPINESAGSLLFEPYTYGNFLEDVGSGKYYGYLAKRNNKIQPNSSDLFNINIPEFNTDNVIGIKNNCADIRKICKARYLSSQTAKNTTCRKVQIAHTLLRLIHSSGYDIALIATYLWKRYHIDAFYALWFAYHIKRSIVNYSSDYGDIFNSNNGFISKESFVSRFFNPDLNGTVQGHFRPENNEIASMFAGYEDLFASSDNIIRDVVLGEKFTMSKGYESLPEELYEKLINTDSSEAINSYLEKAINGNDDSLIKVELSFNKRVFNSVINNVTYKGFVLKSSKLGRILFKDEDECVLSILEKSKFIKSKRILNNTK